MYLLLQRIRNFIKNFLKTRLLFLLFHIQEADHHQCDPILPVHPDGIFIIPAKNLFQLFIDLLHYLRIAAPKPTPETVPVIHGNQDQTVLCGKIISDMQLLKTLTDQVRIFSHFLISDRLLDGQFFLPAFFLLLLFQKLRFVKSLLNRHAQMQQNPHKTNYADKQNDAREQVHKMLDLPDRLQDHP